MKYAVEVHHLKKVFERNERFSDLFKRKKILITALDGISLHIKEGEIFGLLGHNGAGKTTLIKILSTLILPTDGTAKIYDYDVCKNEWEVKKMIGLIHSDERSFFWRLTGRQNLEFFASLFKLPKQTARQRINELLSVVGLEEKAGNMFQTYSTGMKQKLAIARGLLTYPKILFMDEAMRSIDPVSSQKMRNFVKNDIRKLTGGTVIMATNRLDEAAQLCDRVAVIKKGRLHAYGSPAELAASSENSIQYEIEIKNMKDETIQQIRRMKPVTDCFMSTRENGIVRIEIKMAYQDEDIHQVLQWIMNNNGYIHKCSRKQPSFEGAFETIMETPSAHQTGDQ